MKKKLIRAGIVFLVVLIFSIFLSGVLYEFFILKHKPIYDISLYLTSFSEKNRVSLFLMILALLSLIVFVIFMNSNTNEFNSKNIKVTNNISIPEPAGNGQFGNARFMYQNEIDNTFASFSFPKVQNLEKGGLVINYKKAKKSEKISYLDDDIHSLILGATGSGKTRGFILQSVCVLAYAGENMIISDPKGEIHNYCEPFLVKRGYDVKAIDFKNPELSDTYNFLQPIIDALNAGDLSKAIDKTEDFCDAVVPKSSKEKIWEYGAVSCLGGAIMAVLWDNRDKPKYQTIDTVYDFLIEMNTRVSSKSYDTYLDLYVQALSKKFAEESKYNPKAQDHPARKLFASCVNAPPNQRGSFFTEALADIKLMTLPSISNMTRKSSFTLDSGDKKRAIFMITPDEKNTFDRLMALFVNQMYIALVEESNKLGGRLRKRTNFLLDEFGNFAKISNFINALTVGRGRGIRFNIVIQSFLQLEEIYGKSATGVIKDNCSCFIYLSSSNKDTREEISKRIGRYTVATYGRSANKNAGKITNSSTGQSLSLTGRELLNIEEIGKIERPYVLVSLSGKDVFVSKLPDISEWEFNKVLGLGDKEHNQNIRMFRQSLRPNYEVTNSIHCDTWDNFYEAIKMKLSKKSQEPKSQGDDRPEYDDYDE